jgi:hypothetical protein
MPTGIHNGPRGRKRRNVYGDYLETWVQMYQSGRTMKEIGKDFAVSRKVISAVIRPHIQKRQNAITDKTFFDNTISNETTGCIEWVGPKNGAGYGQFQINGTLWLAHRYSYMMHKGALDNLLVLHKCDNPACINPDHLFLGTHADNMRDMVNKGRNQVVNRKLTDEQVKDIKGLLISNSKTLTAIAAMYNMHLRSIQRIRDGVSYKHINP